MAYHIHAFIWIHCAPLIIFDHLYISRVKFYSFLYPLSIMTKRGRKCGFFLRFYMLGGRNTCLCKGELCFILLGGVFTSLLFYELLLASCTLALWPFLHTLCLSLIYIYIYIWCMFSSLTSTCVVFFLSLYTCFFMYVIFISISHVMPWWVLFKCLKKTSCEILSCRELFSCKVFQEFVVGIDLFCNTTSGYEFSDLRLLLWLFFFLLWFCHGLPKGKLLRTYFM